MSNSVQIKYNLLFDQQTYFLCITLDQKNLKFKYLIDDIIIDFWSSWNFTSMEDIIRCNPIVRFLKFTFNKKL